MRVSQLALIARLQLAQARLVIGRSSQAATMIRIADVTTKRTAHIKLEQEGLETVDRVMQASAAFGAKRVTKLLVGDLDVTWYDWPRISASDFLLTGEPWIVKSIEKRVCPDIEDYVKCVSGETRHDSIDAISLKELVLTSRILCY